VKSKKATVKIVCGVDGCDTPVRGRTFHEAQKNMAEHRRSAHPGFVPPKGSMQDRVRRLD
jgi:hypothetical protein